MSSSYCTQSDIEDHYGVDNVEEWAKLNPDVSPTTITARITRAIDWASQRMDSYLRKGGYAIPVLNSSGSTPEEITDVAATLAGWWLYRSRGTDDVDRSGNPRNKLQFDFEEAMQYLRDIRDSLVAIDSIEQTG